MASSSAPPGVPSTIAESGKTNDRTLGGSEEGKSSGSTSKVTEFTYKLKTTDMMPKMLSTAVETAKEALRQSSDASALAAHMKRVFDAQFQPTWHVIVGSHFGSNVIHEARTLAFFYLNEFAVLIFKSGSG